MKLKNRETTASADKHHQNWFDCIRSRQKTSAYRGRCDFAGEIS